MPRSRPTVLTLGAVAVRDWMARRALNQREAAKVLEVHYMCLNQYLLGKRRPGLAVALRIEQRAGVPAGSWTRTVVSKSKSRKSNATITDDKHGAYGNVG